MSKLSMRMCLSVPMDLDVRMKATLLGAVFLIVSLTSVLLFFFTLSSCWFRAVD